MRYFISLFIITFFSINSFAQSGKVEGKITDFKTGQLLSGISVSIVGNDKGVITNQDGHFIITISSGTPQSIRISSVGYKTKVIENVQVAANEVINLDIVLETSIKTEEEIVIKTTLRQETTAALIAYQKNTNTVAQVVSAESIKRSPDKNTSEILKRVPGISIQGG